MAEKKRGFSPEQSYEPYQSSYSYGEEEPITHPQFKKTPNVAQYKGADWKNEIMRKQGISLEEAFDIALNDSNISYFFYMNGSVYMEGKEGPDGWTEKGSFNPGDAVFFSGEPWYGSSYASDAYEKIAGEKTITYSGFQAELPDGKDHLNITPDVQAFANLISSRELNPPLSIGLFGDWGSGKSFFMNQLKKEVRENVSWSKKQIKEDAEQLLTAIRESDQAVEAIKDLLPSIDSQAELIMDWIRQKPSSALEELNILSLKAEEIRQDLLQKPEAAKMKIRESLAANIDQHAQELASGLTSGDQKTEKVLRQLVQTKAERTLGYCRNISQIEFNAWHYVDSNLWASMLNNIFKDLSEFIGILPQEEFNTIQLFNELASTKELLAEAEKEEQRLKDREQAIQESLNTLQSRKETLQKELKDISFSQVWNQLKKDEEVSASLGEAQQLVSKAGEQLGISKEMLEEIKSNPNNIKNLYQHYQSTRGRLAVFWSELKEMNSTERLLLFVFLVVPILALLAMPLLESEWLIPSNWVSSISKVVAVIYSVIKLIPSLITKGEQAIGKINTGLDRLYAAKEKVGQIESMAASQLEIEIQLKMKELSEIEAEEKVIKERQSSLQLKIKETEGELEAIKKGRRLSSFIQGRLNSDDYQKHLGLISTIRSDFEKLTDYLHSRDPISELFSVAEEKQINPFQLEPINKIDRIILYIDDLDRCPPEKVVEVLQAIHLILAFPLFVVVVGVDVRWISKSLIKQYGTMLAPVNESNGTPTDLDAEAEYSLKYKENATPYDYLEKIFQIPFRLQPMDNLTKRKYIGKLLEGDIQESDEQSPEEMNNGDTPPIPAEEGPTPAAATPDEQEVSPQTATLHLAKAHIHQDDLKFIQALSPILSNSPRAIKRFANICRLMRSHEIWGVDINTFRILSSYQCRVFLLALITGLPDLAHKLFDWLNDWVKENQGDREEGTPLLLKDFFDYVAAAILPNQKGEAIREDWNALEQFLKSPAPIQVDALPEGALSIDLLSDWTAREILDLTHAVSRFSFRFEHY
jgi:hypothetical protein